MLSCNKSIHSLVKMHCFGRFIVFLSVLLIIAPIFRAEATPPIAGFPIAFDDTGYPIGRPTQASTDMSMMSSLGSWMGMAILTSCPLDPGVVACIA